MNFNEMAWEFLEKIPRGKVTTYREIAIALGNAGAARAVGNACSKNPFAPSVPCHRVVKSNGMIGNYAKGIDAKKTLLESEGIKIKNNKLLNFESFLVTARELV